MDEDICVIIPTIRQYDCLKSYIQNAQAHDFNTDRLHIVYVTENSCDVSGMENLLDELEVTGRVFDERRRDRWFATNGVSEHAALIPDASHAQTSFGLLYLWANDFEYGFFIDDDTRPHPDWNYFDAHLDNLAYEGTIEQVASDHQWVNVLYQNDERHGLYPRGYPYGAMGETQQTNTTHVDDVVVSQGLWTNVPDLDAVRILMDGDRQGQAQTRLSTDDYENNFVAAPGHYLTVCSMNLAFRREVIPAFYQLPMDDNDWNVGRFDDIWSGIFLKRACDVVGTSIINGAPLCEHNKAPRSTFSDLANEAPGLALNEYLWETVDGVGDRANSYAGVYQALAEVLATREFDLENGAFLNYIGETMAEWLDCLETLQPGSIATGMAVTADD